MASRNSEPLRVEKLKSSPVKVGPVARIGGGIGRGLPQQKSINSGQASPMDSPGGIEEEKSRNPPLGDPMLKMNKVEITEEADQQDKTEDDDSADRLPRRANTVSALDHAAQGSGRKFQSNRAKIVAGDAA